ncbi:DUF1120 domain-containing protein [Pseudomonas sp. XS1P51]
MNKRLSLLTAALLLAGTSSAVAASETDLTVTGTITPAACEPILANGGVIDFGKIRVKDLKETTHTRIGNEIIQLTVNCNASALFAISSRDNREGSASTTGANYFGLGKINGNEKLGRYQMSIKNPVADVPVGVLFSDNEGVSWRPLHEFFAKNLNDWIGFGDLTGSVFKPDFVRHVSVDITIYTDIAPTNSLTLIDEVKLDGSATLQIEYL